MTEALLAKSNLTALKYERMQTEIGIAEYIRNIREQTASYTKRKVREINLKMISDFAHSAYVLQQKLKEIDADMAEINERLG